jgi:hypothetical protein
MSVNNEVPNERADPNEKAQGISSISILFAVINVVALLTWTYFVLVVLSFSGVSAITQDFILYLVPYVYLCFSLYSCFGKNRELRTVKYILNLPLMTLFIIYFIAITRQC